MNARVLAALILGLLFGSLPARAAAPGATLDPVLHASGGWLNGKADSRAIAGKVVVVDVFTFDCINCRHVVPNLQALRSRYANSVTIIGIHSPETPSERERGNVVASLARQGIVWPVALDNSFALWNAYGVDAWPTQLIFDRHGRLRKTIVGEGSDAEMNAEIARLVTER
jgi:thiol-disulfide isomerase/thioredoxin